jgi:hypothetical protein
MTERLYGKENTETRVLMNFVCIVSVITLHWPNSLRLAGNGQTVLLL